MRHLRLISLLTLGLLIVPALFFSVLPAVAAPLAGFTDTPTATPTPTATDTPTPTPTPTPPPVNTSAPPPPPTAVFTDPVIVKGGDPENAPVGAVVTFNLTVSNPSSVDVPGVSVTDPLPAQLDYLGSTTTQGNAVYDAGSHTVTFNVGTLAANQTVSLIIQARVNDSAPPGQTINNTAQLLESGVPHGSSNTVLTNIVPGSMPGTGLPPEPSAAPTIVLAVIAALLPLLGWFGLRRLRRKQT